MGRQCLSVVLKVTQYCDRNQNTNHIAHVSRHLEIKNLFFLDRDTDPQWEGDTLPTPYPRAPITATSGSASIDNSVRELRLQALQTSNRTTAYKRFNALVQHYKW